MTDIWDIAKRSEVMARIRSKGNLSTEAKMVALFKAFDIKGWRRHLPLPGRPDFVFRSARVAVFVDGCFWHGCPRCYRAPGSNVEFWENKVATNRRRDRRVTRQLRSVGWCVLRVWECSLRKRPEATVRRLLRALARER